MVGGVLAGLVQALVSRVLVEASARAKGRRAQAVLQRSVAEVGQRLVVDPVEEELQRYRRVRQAVTRAR